MIVDFVQDERGRVRHAQPRTHNQSEDVKSRPRREFIGEAIFVRGEYSRPDTKTRKFGGKVWRDAKPNLSSPTVRQGKPLPVYR